MKILRVSAVLAVLSALIAVFGTSPALAVTYPVDGYEFPSTNDYNMTHGGPYVVESASGPGWVTLGFYNPNPYSVYFEYRIDGQVLTTGNAHPVIGDDVMYPYVYLANSVSSPQLKTFAAYHTVEIRSARGAERDWDFDWTAFDVPSPTNCVFDTADTTMTLMGDCWTTKTIVVPEGHTLNGNGFTITALDPGPESFTSAVVANAGVSMNVMYLTVQAEGLKIACHAGDARLAGIKLNGASGTIAYNTITGINQGASGCQEGNAIEVRNPPFDGTDDNRLSVEIAHNVIDDYQKTGIVANGNVDANIHHNWVGDSATQATLAANSIQLGFGASGSIKQNTVVGNQWLGTSDDAASAILIYSTGAADVSKNNVRGNSDVGIFVVSDHVTLDNNKVFDEGDDAGVQHLVPATDTMDAHYVTYDIGIGNYGDHNTLTNNKVRGFDTPYDGLDDLGNNKIVGKPVD